MSLCWLVAISPLLASGAFIRDIDDVKCERDEDCPHGLYTKDGRIEGFWRQLHCCRHDQGIYGRCGRSDRECRTYFKRQERVIIFFFCVTLCCCCTILACIGRCCYKLHSPANPRSPLWPTWPAILPAMWPAFAQQQQPQEMTMSMIPSQPLVQTPMATMAPAGAVPDSMVMVQGPQGPRQVQVPPTAIDGSAALAMFNNLSMSSFDGRYLQNR